MCDVSNTAWPNAQGCALLASDATPSGASPSTIVECGALFISLEGGDGVGKSTQAELLAQRLRAQGHHVVTVREPGGTELGDYLRAWLKDGSRPLTPESELLLFAAARAELVRRVIDPALADGAIVIADRYADSTRVYQGSGRGIPSRRVAAALRIATGGLEPALTILLDLDPREAQSRAANRDTASGKRRFEDAGLAFQRRVQRAFQRLAAADPSRWRNIDASRSRSEVEGDVWRAVQEALKHSPPTAS